MPLLKIWCNSRLESVGDFYDCYAKKDARTNCPLRRCVQDLTGDDLTCNWLGSWQEKIPWPQPKIVHVSIVKILVKLHRSWCVAKWTDKDMSDKYCRPLYTELWWLCWVRRRTVAVTPCPCVHAPYPDCAPRTLTIVPGENKNLSACWWMLRLQCHRRSCPGLLKHRGM